MTPPNYKLTDKNAENGTAILRVTKGKYRGVEFAYGLVRFGDETEENMKLTFDLLVSSVPKKLGKTIREIETDPEFQKLAGDALVDIIASNV